MQSFRNYYQKLIRNMDMKICFKKVLVNAGDLFKKGQLCKEILGGGVAKYKLDVRRGII